MFYDWGNGEEVEEVFNLLQVDEFSKLITNQTRLKGVRSGQGDQARDFFDRINRIFQN